MLVGVTVSNVFMVNEPHEYFTTKLLADGMVLVFDASGAFIRKSDVATVRGTLQAVDVVSVLVQEGYNEIAYAIGDAFIKREASMGIGELNNQICMIPGMISTCRRSIDVNCTQYLYVFRIGMLSTEGL